jgi:hypothetical protein
VLNILSSSAFDWNSVSRKTYQVWSTTNLSAPFSTLGGLVNATGPAASYTNNPADRTRYFRVEFLP